MQEGTSRAWPDTQSTARPIHDDCPWRRNHTPLQIATLGYGMATWNLYNGRKDRAMQEQRIPSGLRSQNESNHRMSGPPNFIRFCCRPTTNRKGPMEVTAYLESAQMLLDWLKDACPGIDTTAEEKRLDKLRQAKFRRHFE
jgi:hypothetical protein